MERSHFDELVKKIEAMKAKGEIDLSTEEDLSLAVMNLVSLEEHFFFTAEKTQKPEYFDLMREVREVRKAMLGRLIDRKNHEGETWCITKHLLAATMRLIEVGAKLNGDGDTVRAKETFDYAYRIYSLFWALRLKLIDVKEFKKVAAAEQPWTARDIVERLVDCCDE